MHVTFASNVLVRYTYSGMEAHKQSILWSVTLMLCPHETCKIGIDDDYFHVPAGV